MEKKKVCLFGGTFNPITYSHLLTAEIVMNRRPIDKVLFTPSSLRRRDVEDGLISDEHRLEMIKLAVIDNERLGFCDIELKNLAWLSKTEVVLKKYKEQNPDEEVYFLMGADNLKEISTWDNSEDLVKENKFIVVSVYGYDMLEIIAKDPLLRKYENNFDLMHKGIQMDINSKMIRENVSIDKSIKYMLPEKCISYIKDNNLYIQ